MWSAYSVEQARIASAGHEVEDGELAVYSYTGKVYD